MKDQGDRLPGDLLRRAADSVLSRRIMDSVVIPALADLQHESALARTSPARRRVVVLARGYLAFWTALALCLAAWPARSLREDWLGSDAPGPRLLGALAPRAGLLGFVFTLVLGQWPLRWAGQAGDPWMVLLVFPSVVTVTLPMAFLLGLILAIGRLSVGSATLAPKRWLGPALGLSIVTGLFTFVLYGWVTPEANQSYRERVFRRVTTDQLRHADGRPVRIPADTRVVSISKGTRELTLGELQTRIREGRLQRQSTVPLDVEWHKKWAIPAACLLFGPLAIGLHGLWKRPRTAISFAIALAATLLLYVALRIGEQAAIDGRLGPLPAIWAGDALLALLTLWLIARAPRLRKDEAITA